MNLSIPPALLHTFRLSQNCSGAVEVLHRETWTPVTFDSGSKEWAVVAEAICANLSCGGLYDLKSRQNGTVHLNSTTCLSGCVYSDQQLGNCTEVPQTDCSNLTEIICGKAVIA